MNLPDSGQLARHAQALLDIRRPEEALAVLRPAVAADPQNYDLVLLFAQTFEVLGRHDDALRAAAGAARLAPTESAPHELRVEAMLAKGNLHGADAAADALCRAQPVNPTAHFLKVLTELELGNVLMASRQAELVAALGPGSAMAHHAQGLVHLAQRDWRRAEAQYRAALALEPAEPAFLNNLGLALRRRGKTREAMACFAAAGALDSRESTFRTNTAQAAHDHTGGTSDLPPSIWRVLHPRKRRLPRAAQVAMEIEKPHLDPIPADTSFIRALMLVFLALFLLAVVSLGLRAL